MKYGESLQRTSVPAWSLRKSLPVQIRFVTAIASQNLTGQRQCDA
jgi:hypothetical protein